MTTTLLEKVQRISHSLSNAPNYEQIFGKLPGETLADQERSLTLSFRQLALSIHPDLLGALPDAERLSATETFRKLVEASKKALVALSEGRYQGTAAPDETFSLRSSQTSYTLRVKPVALGQHSKLYGGLSRAGLDVLIKVAKDSSANAVLEREIQFLEKAHSSGEAPDIARFLPEVLDTFIVQNGSQRLRATVYEGLKNTVSVRELIDAFPNGMPAIDAAWVARRILGQVCAATIFGVVHTAIVPEHVMVGVVNHNPLHIGWSHAVEIGERKLEINKDWKAYYPSEITRRSNLDSRADLFMAGKTILELLGGDLESNALPSSVPDAIREVILRCVEPNRSKRFIDGPDALDAMTQAAWSLWGKQYRRLQWPVQT